MTVDPRFLRFPIPPEEAARALELECRRNAVREAYEISGDESLVKALADVHMQRNILIDELWRTYGNPEIDLTNVQVMVSYHADCLAVWKDAVKPQNPSFLGLMLKRILKRK